MGSHLTSPYPGERSQSSCVTFSTCDVLCIEISYSSSGFGESSRLGALDPAIPLIQLALFVRLSPKVAQSTVPDGVGRLERIRLPLTLPALPSHIGIVYVIVAFLARLSSLISGLSLCTLDIKDVQGVSLCVLSFNKWFSTIDVINEHGIPDKLERFWRHISETWQFVDRIERVGGCSVCLELYNLRLCALDVGIGQIELGLVVQTDVKHARTRAQNILIHQIKLRSIHNFLGPYARLRSYIIKKKIFSFSCFCSIM